MSEMVERVMKEIRDGIGPFVDGPLFDDDIRACALAIVKAMREPTEAVTSALDACVCEWQPLYDDEGRKAWQASIDAALK